jgi:hypothetical protein
MDGLIRMYDTRLSTASTSDGSGNHNNKSIQPTIFVDGMSISITLFSISAYYFVKYIVIPQQQQHLFSIYDKVPFYQRRRKSLHNLQLVITSNTNATTTSSNNSNITSDNNTTTTNDEMKSLSSSDPMISLRGKTALLPTIPYQQQFFACLNVSSFTRVCVCVFSLLFVWFSFNFSCFKHTL